MVRTSDAARPATSALSVTPDMRAVVCHAVWHTDLGFAQYSINVTKPPPIPGPATYCDPTAKPPETCPGNLPCPKCGTKHCKCS
eukprot:SAG11_NODE_2998_length_2779_cov_1.738060_1_plen_84_part_00